VRACAPDPARVCDEEERNGPWSRRKRGIVERGGLQGERAAACGRSPCAVAITSNGARRARRPRTPAGEHDFNTARYTWRDKVYPEIRGLRPPTPPIEPFNTDPDSVSQQEYKQACSEYERKLDDYDAKVSRGTTREATVRKELREQRKYEEPERKKAHLGFLEAKSRVATATVNELWEIYFDTGRTPNGRLWPTPARYVSSTEMAQSMWGIQESEATAEYKSILRDVFGERGDRR
jgi:hypothetical protein